MVRLFNLATLEQREFPLPGTTTIPPYAVLSHVWNGPEQEVSYIEWQRMLHYKRLEEAKTELDPVAAADYQAIKRKPGLAKINSFIRTVPGNDAKVEWGWEHGCCVDVTNQAEVDHAVLTHWELYCRSAMCHAFLDDVPPDTPPLKSMPSEFCSARWFGRGWTLPELVAPPEVRFYDCRWGLLASRRVLQDVLCVITQIEERFLGGSRERDLAMRLPLAHRLAWGGLRQVNRPEDRAYSIMGLVDANIPPRYGEGEAAAFTRLMNCALARSADPTLLAWGFRMSGPWCAGGLLAPSPKPFAACRDVVSMHSRPEPVRARLSPDGRGYLLTAKFIRPHDPESDHIYAVLDAKHQPTNTRLVLPLIPVRKRDPHCTEYWRAPSCVPLAFRHSLASNGGGEWRTVLVLNGSPPVAHTLSLRVLGLESADYHGVLQEVWPPTIFARDGAEYLPRDEDNVPDRTDRYIFLRVWSAYDDSILVIRYQGYWAEDHTSSPHDPDARTWPRPTLPRLTNGYNGGGTSGGAGSDDDRPRQINPTHLNTRIIGFRQLSPWKENAYVSLAEYFFLNEHVRKAAEVLFETPARFHHHQALFVERRPPRPDDVNAHQDQLVRGVPGARLAPWDLAVTHQHGPVRPMDGIFIHRKPREDQIINGYR